MAEKRTKVIVNDTNSYKVYEWLLTDSQLRLMERLKPWLHDLDILWETKDESEVEVI